MKKYTKIYLEAFGYSTTDFIPSEISGEKAVDIHHIICKGSGGDPTGNSDRIENLMAVTRNEHLEYGDKKQYISFLFEKHMEFMELNGVKFDKNYILSQIENYKQYE